MPAVKIAEPLPQSQPPEHAATPYASPEAPFHLASELDEPVASPVATMQAQLARELGRPRRKLRFDPFWPLAALFSLACWWGLISIGMVVVRAYLHG
jgi:hypothetical protein